MTDKDTIVLADFTNTTGDPVFDGTLRQGLAVQLEQSPFLSLVSEQRIQQTLRLMGQPADAQLSPEIARELCQRMEGAAVLHGSIASLGSQYVLGLKAVNCRTGDPIAKRTFILESDYQPDNGVQYPAVVSYDPSTFKLAGAIYFSLPTSPLSLVRWGSDGFVFLTGVAYGDFTKPTTGAQLAIFRSSLATPGPGTIATVTSLSPASVAPGSRALTLTVNGSGFGADSTVLWNGVIRATTFVSTNQLTAVIAAADLATTGTAQVSVSNGGTVSPSVPFIIGSSAVTLSPTSLTYALQALATASTSQTVTVHNSGTAPLTGINIGLVGADLGSFVTNSTCSNSLAAGDSCVVNVVFNPISAGNKQATLQIADSAADSPQTVILNGTAAVASLVLSSQSLSFGQLPAGASAQQVLTLRNSSAVPLANISVAVSGQNSADFTAASNCGSSLAAGGNCTVSVTFAPSVTGDKNATLTLSGAGVTAQAVALSGTSTPPDFVLPAPAGSSTAAVPAGQPATFNLNVSPSGSFTGAVAMSCTNLPAYAACTFTPATFTVGSTPIPVTLNISTQQTVCRIRPPGVWGVGVACEPGRTGCAFRVAGSIAARSSPFA